MKVVAFVPIKLNNERLPGKNIKRFDDGTPLIACILDTLLNVNGLDEIYVYCSNPGIEEYLPAGVKFLRRSPSLDQSSTKINEVLSSFAKDVPADVYVLAHATAPFVKAKSIEVGIEKVVSSKHDSAFTVLRLQEFMWKDGKPLNYQLDSVPRTQDLDPIHTETTGLYIYTSELINERNIRIGESPYLIEISKIESTDVNEPIDFDIANAIYSKRLNSLEENE